MMSCFYILLRSWSHVSWDQWWIRSHWWSIWLGLNYFGVSLAPTQRSTKPCIEHQLSEIQWIMYLLQSRHLVTNDFCNIFIHFTLPVQLLSYSLLLITIGSIHSISFVTLSILFTLLILFTLPDSSYSQPQPCLTYSHTLSLHLSPTVADLLVQILSVRWIVRHCSWLLVTVCLTGWTPLLYSDWSLFFFSTITFSSSSLINSLLVTLFLVDQTPLTDWTPLTGSSININ